MMKNKISDMRNHLFAALERLDNEELTADQLRLEIEKSRAISDIGKVIVESAKTEILYAKLTGKTEEQPTKFLGIEGAHTKPIQRPKAEYSNISPYNYPIDQG